MVKEHHLDLGGLYFYSIITWVAVFLYSGLYNGPDGQYQGIQAG
jgi:hypothetical protein